MRMGDKDLKVYVLIGLLLVLAFLVFVLLKPILLSIIGGLILAYIFLPVYDRILKKVKGKNIAAFLVLLVVMLIIVVPIWFVLPVLVDNVFDLFKSSQGLDINGFVSTIFPSSSNEFVSQMTVTIQSGISRISSGILNSLIDVLLNAPKIILNLFIIGFVFFFTLRDKDQLKQFMVGLSPLSQKQEKILVRQFKNITESIIYGQIIVGLVQGLVAGVGLLVFGVSNAFVLTAIAVVASIIPFVGPGIVWVPTAVFLFMQGSPGIATGFIIYNLLITSLVDNFLRTYIVSRRSKMSQAVILVGMVGGLFVFGILGLVLGPLILAYFITFLNAYKEREMSSAFNGS